MDSHSILEIFALQNIYSLYEENQLVVMIAIMLLAFYPVLLITKKIIFPSVTKIVKHKSEKYASIIDKHGLSKKLVHFFAALYLVIWGEVFNKYDFIPKTFSRIEDAIVTIYLIFAVCSFLIAILYIGEEIYQTSAASNKLSISLHIHILKIIVYICAILTIISHVLGMSISSFFTSLGAAAALLTFVFKDAVLGLMASVQLTIQDFIRVGDWITLPGYNADGTIEKITINVVVIRNFDKTFTTIPTYALLTTGVKNWRGMFQSGGRRIKRAINIDMHTIKIFTQEKINSLKKIPFIQNLVIERPELFDANNGIANVTLFRKYAEQYLKNNEHIHKESFTFLVRQLDPTENGLPIQLYIFTNDTKWVNYEEIQSDIIDHLLAILPKFELDSFQADMIVNYENKQNTGYNNVGNNLIQKDS